MPGVTLASGATVSVAQYTKETVTISPQREFVGKGLLELSIFPSAIGMYVTINVGGITLVDDQPVAWFGTTGSMDVIKNKILSQLVSGGRVEFILRNSTAGALTNDYLLTHTPM